MLGTRHAGPACSPEMPLGSIVCLDLSPVPPSAQVLPVLLGRFWALHGGPCRLTRSVLGCRLSPGSNLWVGLCG